MTPEQAIQTLRTLLQRANTRIEQAQQAEAASEQEALARQNAEVAAPQTELIYLCFDGDGIGNRVAIAEECDDEKALSEVSARINAGQDLFRNWVTQFGGLVIEQGGDEGLAKVPGSALEDLEGFRENYKNMVGASVTCGVGSTISQSTRARELGKLRGKNQTVTYFEGLNEELESRLDEEGPQDERSKMQAAGLGKPVDHDDVPKWGTPPEAWDGVDEDGDDQDDDFEEDEDEDENAGEAAGSAKK